MADNAENNQTMVQEMERQLTAAGLKWDAIFH